MSNTAPTRSVAIFGATGAQGAPVVREALANGMTVRAVARNAGKIAEMHPGAKAVAADINSSDDIADALAGVDAAFFHLPLATGPSSASDWLGAFITGAVRAKLPLLVYSTSGPAGNKYPFSMMIDGIRAGIEAVANCPVPAITLQPALYLENLMSPVILPRVRTEGILDYPPFRASRQVTWTSHHDQAKIAVAALRRLDLAGNRYDLGSHGALNGPELAALIGGWLGREVVFDPLDPARFGQRMGEAFGNPGVAMALTDLYEAQAGLNDAGAPVDTANLEKIFDVPLGTVADHIRGWPLD